MPGTTPLTLLALAALGASSSPQDPSIGGHVQDPEGRPIQGARVCYLVPGGADVLCATTDAQGSYRLPRSRLPTLRVSAEGYLPLTFLAASRGEPLRLRRAASLWVRLKDASTGGPIPNGEVSFVTSSGRVRGPFPATAGGVRIRTLEPGTVRVTGRAVGYEDATGVAVQLVGGEEAQIVLELRPSSRSPAS
jgi:hypothetical protein